MFIYKVKIFFYALRVACELFGIDEQQLRCSRTFCAVEARYCLIMALSGYLCDAEMAQLLGKTRQAINHLRNNRALDSPTARVAIMQIKSKLQANDIFCSRGD